MQLTVTRVIRYRRGLQEAADGIALVRAGAEPGSSAAGRIFLPGVLPCGECPPCRRAQVGSCLNRRQVIPLGDAAVPGDLDLPDRFLTPIDEPAGLPPLADEAALLAGLVAGVLSAMAALSAAPGDQALWLGRDVTAALGAELGRARGLKSRLVTGPQEANAQPSEELDGSLPGQHGRVQQLLFVTTADEATLTLATSLAQPASSMLVLTDAPLRLPAAAVLPPDARLVLQSAYHPDLIPEALAALRRPDLDVAAALARPDLQQR